MVSNCILWAMWRYVGLLAAWIRAGRPKHEEPHIWARPSRLEPWWLMHCGVDHFDGELWVREEFRPINPTNAPWYLAWTHILFRGRVERTLI